MPPRTKRTRAQPKESKEDREKRLADEEAKQYESFVTSIEKEAVPLLSDITKMTMDEIYKQYLDLVEWCDDIDTDDFVWIAIGRAVKEYRKDVSKEIKEIEVNIESEEKKEEKKENES